MATHNNSHVLCCFFISIETQICRVQRNLWTCTQLCYDQPWGKEMLIDISQQTVHFKKYFIWTVVCICGEIQLLLFYTLICIFFFFFLSPALPCFMITPTKPTLTHIIRRRTLVSKLVNDDLSLIWTGRWGAQGWNLKPRWWIHSSDSFPWYGGGWVTLNVNTLWDSW